VARRWKGREKMKSRKASYVLKEKEEEVKNKRGNEK